MLTRSLLSLVFLAAFVPLAEARQGVKPVLPTRAGLTAEKGFPGSTNVDPAPGVRASTPPAHEQAGVADAGLAPTSLTAGGPAIDLGQVYFDRPESTDLWVRGTSYKARFGRDAVEFIPFLGASAPRNYPVRLALESVRVGETELAFARDVAVHYDGPAVSAGGELVSYDRGTLVEHYVVEAGSIEQRFRLDAPPAVPGDLVIRVGVDSALAEAAEDADGFRFSNDLGGVRYGRAVTFDGLGLSTSSPTRLVEGGVEIRVPASFLAAATYPLVVDPLVSAFLIDGSGHSTAYPEVSFDVTHQAYAVVWEFEFSQSDTDIWVQTHSTSGAFFPGSGFWIDTTSDTWKRPKIANNNLTDQFLIVGTRGGYSGEIWGRMRSAASISMSPQFRIDGQEFGLKSNVDVGGDPDLVPSTYFCVVWQNNADEDDRDIHCRMVGTNAQPAGNTFAIDASSGNDSDPAISKSDGIYPWGSQRWTVVWSRYAGTSNWDTYGSQISWNGSIAEPTFPIDTSSNSTPYPTVSTILDGGVGNGGSGPRPYLVAWVQGSDIWGRVMQGSTPLTLATNLTALEGGFNQGYGQLSPCVDSDGSTFVMAYAESRPGTGYDIYLAEYDYAGGQLHCTDPNRMASASTPMEINPRLASRRGAGGEPGDFMAVWHEIGGGDVDVEGAILRSQSFGHTYCTSYFNTSGDLAHVRMEGSRSIEIGDMSLVAENCPPNKSGLFFLGTAQVDTPFGEGRRCVGGQVKRLPIQTTSPSGVAVRALNFAAGYASGITPGPTGVNYQFWFRDPQGGPAGFNTSDALHVEHTP